MPDLTNHQTNALLIVGGVNEGTFRPVKLLTWQALLRRGLIVHCGNRYELSPHGELVFAEVALEHQANLDRVARILERGQLERLGYCEGCREPILDGQPHGWDRERNMWHVECRAEGDDDLD